ncbi:hypothetical protein [Pacificibacter marinus]|uniref:hypothetical protein n=1 Tax=Pacificibacter marinus TaxID=658057 RepID=UPI001C0693D3|nr:hypothetical protein [Pacificibacter marinus]MBU2867466.1 hypothetical protein [Pacificibacter marinus]
MSVDLMKLEKRARQDDDLPSLHYEYTFTNNGGRGQIFLSPSAQYISFTTRELPMVVRDVIKFAAKRMDISEGTLRKWVALTARGEELPCDALTKAGLPCKNPVECHLIPENPREFDPSAKIYCAVHMKMFDS